MLVRFSIPPRQETYPLSNMHTNRTDSSIDHERPHIGTRDGPRLAGEEYADDDVDAFIAENEGFQHSDRGECSFQTTLCGGGF